MPFSSSWICYKVLPATKAIPKEMLPFLTNLYCNMELKKLEPHDASSNMAIIGRDILTQDIFDIIIETKAGKNGEI